MNIETRYFNLKHDVTENLKSFILNPETILQRHRADRLNDTFAGVTEDPRKGSWYKVVLYLSDYKTKEKIRTFLFVDRKFNIINEEIISA